MTRFLTRRGRLAVTLGVCAAVVCLFALRDNRSVAAVFGITFASELAVVALAAFIDSRPWRRRRGPA